MLELGYSSTMTLIPDDTIRRLKSLRDDDPERFRAKIKGLNEELNWSLRKIANSFGDVSASGVAIWKNTASYADVEGLPAAPRRDPVAAQKPKRERVEVSIEDKQRIAELTPVASQVRRFTPPNHPARAAAQELEDILHRNSERGVTLQQLADASGRTRRAIAQRLEKRNGHSTSEDDPS